MQVLGMSPPSSPTSSTHEPGACFDRARHAKRKRIPEVHDGERERLSKRLSLLKLEQHSSIKPETLPDASSTSLPHTPAAAPALLPDESMQLDDSKHRVYIHSIDDELSSDSEHEDGRLIFHPDFRKHLRPSFGGGGGSSSSIPRRIVANDDGELAGMQIVLYREPKALSVSEEHDGVRKMVKEARQRMRDRQKMERQGVTLPAADPPAAAVDTDVEVHDDDNGNDGDDDDDDDAMELD